MDFALGFLLGAMCAMIVVIHAMNQIFKKEGL